MSADLVAAHELHLEYLRAGSFRVQTIEGYARAEQEFLTYLGEHHIPAELDALHPNILDSYARWAAASRRPGGSQQGKIAIARHIAAIKAWSRFLFERNILLTDPLAKPVSPTLEAHRRDLQLSEFGQAIEDCFYAAIVEGRSRQTVKGYRGSLNWLLQYASEQGVTTLAGLTPRLLQGAAMVLMEPRDATAYHWNFKGGQHNVRLLIVATRFLARWAAAQGIGMPDLSSLKYPRVPERVQPRVTAEEFRAMEAAALHRRGHGDRKFRRFTSARDLALISFLGDTALRIHEVCALDLDDVDMDQGTVIVRRGKGGRGASRAAARRTRSAGQASVSNTTPTRHRSPS